MRRRSTPESTPRSRREQAEAQARLRSKLQNQPTPGPGHYGAINTLNQTVKGHKAAITPRAKESPSAWAASSVHQRESVPSRMSAPGEYEPRCPGKAPIAVSAAADSSPSMQVRQGRGLSLSHQERKGVDMTPAQAATPGPGSYGPAIASGAASGGSRCSTSPTTAFPQPDLGLPSPTATQSSLQASFKSSSQRFVVSGQTCEGVGPQSYSPDQGEQIARARQSARGPAGAECYPCASVEPRSSYL